MQVQAHEAAGASARRLGVEFGRGLGDYAGKARREHAAVPHQLHVVPFLFVALGSERSFPFDHKIWLRRRSASRGT